MLFSVKVVRQFVNENRNGLVSSGTYLRGKRKSVDLIEGYDRHAFLEPAILQKVLANTLVLDDDII